MNWYYIDEEVARDLFFPKLKIRNAKEITIQPGYGPTDTHYFWFQYPHHLEYKETLKVTVYCSLNFEMYPFDSHQCVFSFGASDNAVYNLKLKPSLVLYEDMTTGSGITRLKIDNSRLNFDVYLKSIEPYTLLDTGYYYSHAGIEVDFKRKGIGLLMGSFFGPLAIFKILSLISFHIKADMVSLKEVKALICF